LIICAASSSDVRSLADNAGSIDAIFVTRSLKNANCSIRSGVGNCSGKRKPFSVTVRGENADLIACRRVVDTAKRGWGYRVRVSKQTAQDSDGDPI
jgi:hypothetical protein